MKSTTLSRLLAALAILVWALMLFPHPYTAVLAGAIACLSLPLYRWFRARTAKVVALSLYILFLGSCIVLPFTIITVLVAPQAMAGYRTILQWSTNGFALPPAIQELVDKIYALLLKIPGFSEWLTELSDNIQAMLGTAVKTVLSGGLGFAGSTVSILWQTVLMIVLAALAVTYAPTLFRLAVRITALPEDSVARLVKATRNALRSVFVGILFVSTIQGILTGIGLAIMGISEPAFWGTVAAFCAAIPVVGTALVWIPMSIVLWVQGSPMSAVGLLVWGTVVVSGSDNLCRPYFLKTGIETSILVLFLSIICAMAAFGVIGLILGPVLVAIGIQAAHESDYLR